MKVEVARRGDERYPISRPVAGMKSSTAASSSADGVATKTPSNADRRAPVSVVIIDDEDDDDDEDVVQARRSSNDAGSANSLPRKEAQKFDDVKNMNPNDEDEDDDECRILGTRRVRPVKQPKVTRRTRERKLDMNDLTGFSECEVEVATGSQAAHIRRQWEEAAIKRRLGRPAASKVSRVGRAEESWYAAAGAAAEGPTFFEQRSVFRRQGSAAAESVSTSASGAEHKAQVEAGPSNYEVHKTTETAEVESCRPGISSVLDRNGDGRQVESVEDKPAESVEEKPSPSQPSGVIFREEIKESAEYQKANEEEWARRQLELEKQAQEVQRLRKRKKAEAERRLAIEHRQKQRVETIRQEQQQEVKNTGMKEKIRSQVQVELEKKAFGCPDMATLLRRLGVEVEAGAQCTPSQVNAAYKKALFRFHPDRASGNNDMAAQVRAEETFKLISRLKATLEPVATMRVVRRP